MSASYGVLWELNKIIHAEHQYCKMVSAAANFNPGGHGIVQKQIYPAMNYWHILLLETTAH